MASFAAKAKGMPLETNQPLAGEIGLRTVVAGAVLSTLKLSGAPTVSVLPAPSLLQNSTVCSPAVATEKAPE